MKVSAVLFQYGRERLVVWCIAALVFLVVPSLARAATLSVIPVSGSFKIGDSFSVSIVVSSPDQAMNAADGVLSFPSDKLQITSLGKSGSIINLWAQEPSFSNGDGTVSFEGVALNPGFTGAHGKILSVTFKVRAVGNALLSFSSGSVLANDGKGTNILTALGRAEFSLSSGSWRPRPSPAAPAPLKGNASSNAPEIRSPTHPDPLKWYSAKDAEFAWDIPKGVTAVATLLSTRPDAEPSIVYSPPISERKVKDLEDGVVYFHLQFKGESGWGETAHFRVQVDTTPPRQFRITFPHGAQTEDPRPIMYFTTTDILSGISHYLVKVGEEGFLRMDPRVVESNPYSPPPQEPGTRAVVIKAVDGAGNETVAASEFTVLAIASPRFIDYPTELIEGDLLQVRGVTQPQAEVEASVSDGDGVSAVQKSKANENGDFTMVWSQQFSVGRYTLEARSIDTRGSMSNWSEPRTIIVKRKALFTIGSFVLTYLSLAIIGIALLGLVGFISIYLWGKAKRTRRAIAKEIEDAQHKVHKAFDLLRQEVREQIGLLERAKTKRELTHEEAALVKRLQKNLDDAEKFIGAEIRDIQKEL